MRVAARERSMKNFAMISRMNIGIRISASAAPTPMRYMSPVTLWRIWSRTSGGSGGTGSTEGSGGTGMPSALASLSSGGAGVLGGLGTVIFLPFTSMSIIGLSVVTPAPIDTPRFLRVSSSDFVASLSASSAALSDCSSAFFTRSPSSGLPWAIDSSAWRRASRIASRAVRAASRVFSSTSRLERSTSRPASRSSWRASSRPWSAWFSSSRRSGSLVEPRMLSTTLRAISIAFSAKALSISRLMALRSSGVEPSLR